MPADPYQILLEEHIIRKNAGLQTEHPFDMMCRIENERLDELHSCADSRDNHSHENEDSQDA